MPITTNDAIQKFGTRDEVTIASPATVPNNLFSAAGDVTNWTNDENAPYAAFLLQMQWLTTAPTDGIGSIELFARPIDIEGTDEPSAPQQNFLNWHVGTFPIDWAVAADTLHWTAIPFAALPVFHASQILQFYIFNNGSGQTIASGWSLFVQPFTYGPA